MSGFLAHSARDGHPAQSYADHVQGVLSRALENAETVERYSTESRGALCRVVCQAALLHDLGKLDDENQRFLRGEGGKSRRLPVNHVDAGAAFLKGKGCWFETLAVYSHHRGLPDMDDETSRGDDNCFRDEGVKERVDGQLDDLLKKHKASGCDVSVENQEIGFDGDRFVFSRVLLSCLADADHTDTAMACGKYPEAYDFPELRAQERLQALDDYVSNLGCGDERGKFRSKVYRACRDREIEGGISVCDSPVGSGKTTAVMAHLLQEASRRKARHIFVVLPFTNIIQQSVDTYRKALVLEGETPEEVVAELHCRADFEDEDLRHLTSLWKAPIVVTTAVAFFETMASNRPAALRRFHELPGSLVFLDEAHAALPLTLLPLAWRWMNVLAEEWGCYWVLASGSLVRYWELPCFRELDMPHLKRLPNLIGEGLREELGKYESRRTSFHHRLDSPMSRKELEEWIFSFDGPRLLVVNTVQTAAVVADDLSKSYGREKVEHLSTALMPEDRESVIEKVKSRLGDKKDTDWVLVATSCVEAGVDFSFRTGFRELASLLSLLQMSGRVNRHGSFRDSETWTFTLRDDSMIKSNPALDTSRDVLKGYFERGREIVPSLSTESMQDEIVKDDSCMKSIKCLLKLENGGNFKRVTEKFKVIPSETVLAVVDKELANEIRYGRGDWRSLQRKSVSVRREKVKDWHLELLAAGVYGWTLSYDPFLGYMAGVLSDEKMEHEFLSY